MDQQLTEGEREAWESKGTSLPLRGSKGDREELGVRWEPKVHAILPPATSGQDLSTASGLGKCVGIGVA